MNGRVEGGKGGYLTRAKNLGGESTYEQSVCHGKARVVSERASGGVEFRIVVVGDFEMLAVPLPVDSSRLCGRTSQK